MSLEHEFYLIPATVDMKNFWMDRENNENIIESVMMHDDLIQYILDSLKEVPSRNPASRKVVEQYGFNYHGVTLFDHQSSNKLQSVLSAWREVFKNNSPLMELTIEEENLTVDRDKTIASLEKLMSMTLELDDKKHYIYHCGI